MDMQDTWRSTSNDRQQARTESHFEKLTRYVCNGLCSPSPSASNSSTTSSPPHRFRLAWFGFRLPCPMLGMPWLDCLPLPDMPTVMISGSHCGVSGLRCDDEPSAKRQRMLLESTSRECHFSFP